MSKTYGWYSQGMIENCGGFLHKTPDGGIVEVAMVHTSATDHETGWDDMICVGEVGEFVGRADPKTLEAACTQAYDDEMRLMVASDDSDAPYDDY